MSLNFFFKKIVGQLRKGDDPIVSQPFTFTIHYHAFIRRHICFVLVKSFGNIKGATLVIYSKTVCSVTLKKLQKQLLSDLDNLMHSNL